MAGPRIMVVDDEDGLRETLAEHLQDSVDVGASHWAAADALGISRTTLWRRMRELELVRQDVS